MNPPAGSPSNQLEPLDRWRLVLGKAAGNSMPCSGAVAGMDAALEWLYGRDRDRAERGERTGGTGESSLSVPEWISEIHKLFPKETIERLERDAVERYQIDEVVTNPEVLSRVEPDETLLQAVLRTKHLMRPDVLAMARKLVEAVVRRIMERLQTEVRIAFAGALDRRRRSNIKIARNLDFRRTLAKNLGRWSPATRRLYIESPLFFSRTKRHTDRWQIILVVDQSGSMVSSVIHSAVTAACLWGLPKMTTHLIAFDTKVVDLTRDVTDPVELLMKVQLGGGTDIARAMEYAAGLIEAPRRAIVVLVTDFYEGGSPELLVRTVASLAAQGTRVLGLAALDEQANPTFDRELAQRLVNVGAHVGAMTPGELATWIAEKVRS
ncbi:MAG: VWA domain-containing protein [Polyangiaceae bacterium]